MIATGGYGKIWHPPRADKIFPPKYRGNKKYIQRYTQQTSDQIKNGKVARMIFDPEGTISSPILGIYKRPDGRYSEILPFRDDALYKLYRKFFYDGNLPLYWKAMEGMVPIMRGLERLHDQGWIHHDIKSENMLYDNRPSFRLFLTDWGTALPISEVYSDDYSHWHVASLTNLPPEYKSFAHFQYGFPLKNNSFSLEFAKNPYIINMRQLQPHYMTMLDNAHQTLQKIFHKNQKNLNKVLMDMAPKADVFGLGLVLSQMYTFFAKGKNIPTHTKNQIITLLRNMIHPNPFLRWDMHKVAHYLEKILQDRKKTNTTPQIIKL